MRHYHFQGLGRFLAVIGCILVGAVVISPAWAASYPDKSRSIQLIVGVAAGGPVDVGARLLADGLEKELGTPVVVMNKVGAQSQVGWTYLAQSKPDGYTFGATNLPTIVTGYMDPERKATYNRKSFEPLALHVSDASIFAVLKSSPYKSLKDVVEAAKAKPRTITITSGIMNDDQLAIVQLEKMTGAKFAPVNFTMGSAAAMVAFLGKKIDVLCLNVGDILAQFKRGEILVLGVMDDKESPLLPGVKTFEAQGYKVYNDSSRGFSFPAGTPKNIVDIMSGAIKKVVATEQHKKRMADMGLVIRYMDPVQYSKYWEDCEKKIKELWPLLKE
jgi:tripartite-type tricarboxylate transporter receptor subunit TctC